MNEEWRPISGFPNYEVSNTGLVRNAKTKRVLVPAKWGRDKKELTVQLGRGNSRKVAHLVLETFIGPRPEGMIALHGPMGRDVNSSDNLSWGTICQNNNEDRIRDGTAFLGEKSPSAKLNSQQVLEIRSRTDKTKVDLAAEYNVCVRTIYNIKSRTLWRHLS